MKLNMGIADRSIRLAIAAIIAILYFTGQITGTVAIVLGIVAIVFVATSIIGWCPGYLPLGISTRKGE
jgi:K+-transporting ATPase A subunit